MQRRLEGQIILVTGAAGGIGHSIVERLDNEGAIVIATDLSAADIDFTSCSGKEHISLALDVSDERAWASTMQEEVERRFGRLNGLVNNAGIGSSETIEGEELDNWNRVVAITQTGVWLGMKHSAALLRTTPGSSVVNMCSILGTVGGLGNSAAYHAAKGAVRTLTKNAALHWARGGPRVNSLHPGFVGTPQLYERFEGTERHAAMLANTPMGRLAEPHEIASVVAFLLSPDSTYMTGSEIYVDGGWTAA